MRITDKLATVIGGAEPGHKPTLVDPERATDRVREAFIVIDRNGLPEVEPERPGYAGYVHIEGELRGLLADVEQYDDAIRELVALREYRREHPCVDERAVEALAEAMTAADSDGTWSIEQIARRLIVDGWAKPEVSR
ncbi:hypothetical protein [Oerskovia paurometabola]|uniref:hypothetical protein n=1 Tax=Oerskovia paurometabola TaxID=162170 RepID=UPI0038269F59